MLGRSQNHLQNKLREDMILYLLQLKCQKTPDSSLENKIKEYQKDDSLQSILERFRVGLARCDKFRQLFSAQLEYRAQARGGRKYHYDFYITGSDNRLLGHPIVEELKLEFKYGAETIHHCPQWVSPHRPSRYFDISFEEFHYQNFLPQIMKILGLEIPPLSCYLKEVHQPVPPCLKDAQDEYYCGAKGSSRYTGNPTDIFCYRQVKKISQESISQFLRKASLNLDALNQYLRKTQADKIYLLWDNHQSNFQIEKPCLDDYTIQHLSPDIWRGHTIRGTTVSGKPIQIMLRWKNGNGIAYPAFQIK